MIYVDPWKKCHVVRDNRLLSKPRQSTAKHSTAFLPKIYRSLCPKSEPWPWILPSFQWYNEITDKIKVSHVWSTVKYTNWPQSLITTSSNKLYLVYMFMGCIINHHHKSLNCEGHRGTTDDFATSFLHFPLFFTALWDLPNSGPVHSLMLSSHLFLCPPCLLPPFTVPCKMVLARLDERETWPYHCSLPVFTMVKRSSCGPIGIWPHEGQLLVGLIFDVLCPALSLSNFTLHLPLSQGAVLDSLGQNVMVGDVVKSH